MPHDNERTDAPRTGDSAPAESHTAKKQDCAAKKPQNDPAPVHTEPQMSDNQQSGEHAADARSNAKSQPEPEPASAPAPEPAPTTADAREARLAKALRANLRRRKASPAPERTSGGHATDTTLGKR